MSPLLAGRNPRLHFTGTLSMARTNFGSIQNLRKNYIKPLTRKLWA